MAEGQETGAAKEEKEEEIVVESYVIMHHLFTVGNLSLSRVAVAVVSWGRKCAPRGCEEVIYYRNLATGPTGLSFSEIIDRTVR